MFPYWKGSSAPSIDFVYLSVFVIIASWICSLLTAGIG
ncbi:hypothetical protein CHCC20335_0110 [Bacillus paralicheniformis]|nr:hypothetical protein CHCC20335_0110 [Bacillus paralicheniformis]